ncbi:unnamed protein product [Mytilus edulis]|uniref:Uncharacterized protein n=1 Tax=Mytilus edulis TaxID=6550 RepID=A0A8S3U8D3_MYTED|nr:unnamed protein product [Mytilus edulis]
MDANSPLSEMNIQSLKIQPILYNLSGEGDKWRALAIEDENDTLNVSLDQLHISEDADSVHQTDNTPPPEDSEENDNTDLVEPIFTPVHILDESFVSLTQEDDPEDVDYSLSVDQVESDSDNFENDISTCYTEEQKLIKENKFIVFESAIDTLINKLKCNICECPVDPDDIVKDLSNGTVITITANCTSGHIVVKWSSQPFLGKMPVGNLLVSAATLFCGQTYSHISQFAEFCNLQYISHTTYNKIQRQYLMPVVQHTWSLLQEVELKKIKEQKSPDTASR